MAERPAPSYTGDQPFFFVSYGHADSDLVYAEMRWLREAGFNLWYDEGIHVGSVWLPGDRDALATAGMLFTATKSSIESDNCLKELSFSSSTRASQCSSSKLTTPSFQASPCLSLADLQMLKRRVRGEDFTAPG